MLLSASLWHTSSLLVDPKRQKNPQVFSSTWITIQPEGPILKHCSINRFICSIHLFFLIKQREFTVLHYINWCSCFCHYSDDLPPGSACIAVAQYRQCLLACFSWALRPSCLAWSCWDYILLLHTSGILCSSFPRNPSLTSRPGETAQQELRGNG